MKKLAYAAVAALLIAAPVRADVVDYAELFGGASMSPDLGWGSGSYEMDTGFNLGASLGWNVAPNISVEAEFYYDQSDYSCCAPNNLESFSMMANGFYNFPTTMSVRPYVGAGIGYMQLTYDSPPDYQLSDWVFAYQGIAGLDIPADGNLDFILEYRYRGSNDAEDGGLTFEYESHALSAGIRINL